MNVRPVPAIEAIPPRIGPQSAPPIARPNAVPISAPRRPGGAAATSQASAPVHENELASPCAKRARSSCQTESAKPNAVRRQRDAAEADDHRRLDAGARGDHPARDRPDERARRIGGLQQPPPVLPIPNSAAYCGSSGVSAAKNIVSTKTIAPTR